MRFLARETASWRLSDSSSDRNTVELPDGSSSSSRSNMVLTRIGSSAADLSKDQVMS